MGDERVENDFPTIEACAELVGRQCLLDSY